jgi:large subunit ribosomal protein L30
MLKVTLKRSPIKATESQRATVRGLGLRKVNSTRLLQDTVEVRGMLTKVFHLVTVEEVAE